MIGSWPVQCTHVHGWHGSRQALVLCPPATEWRPCPALQESPLPKCRRSRSAALQAHLLVQPARQRRYAMLDCDRCLIAASGQHMLSRLMQGSSAAAGTALVLVTTSCSICACSQKGRTVIRTCRSATQPSEDTSMPCTTVRLPRLSPSACCWLVAPAGGVDSASSSALELRHSAKTRQPRWRSWRHSCGNGAGRGRRGGGWWAAAAVVLLGGGAAGQWLIDQYCAPRGPGPCWHR